MNNLKYAIDGIIKRPLMFFIILCQIIIGVSIINAGFSKLFETLDNEKAIKSTFNLSNIYYLDNETNDYELNTGNELSFYNYLIDNKDFKYCVNTDTNILIKDFTEENKFYFTTEHKYLENPYHDINGKFSNVKALIVDRNYVDTFKLSIKSGRSFTDEDFDYNNNKDYIPIILGSNYSDIYEVNDEFQIFDYFNKELRYVRVVGILDNNTYHLLGKSVGSLENNILWPFETITVNNQSSDKYVFALKAGGYIVHNNSNLSIDSIFEDIYMKAKELNQGSYYVTSAKSTIDFVLDNLKDITKSSMFITSLIVIFTTFGITLIQINNINDRIKDYGVHLLVGCRKKDIILRNIYELIIYGILGTTIGLFLNILSVNSSDIAFFNKRAIISIVIIYAIIIAIISIILGKKIKKIEINEIIRGVN